METRALWTQLPFHSLKRINCINYVAIYSNQSPHSFEGTERRSEHAWLSPNMKSFLNWKAAGQGGGGNKVIKRIKIVLAEASAKSRSEASVRNAG